MIHSLSNPFPPTALRRRQAETVKDGSSGYKIDYVVVIKHFLNLEGHQNPMSTSKVTAILLKGFIWPIGGVASGRVCACNLRSRLVFRKNLIYPPKTQVLANLKTSPLQENKKLDGDVIVLITTVF